MKKMHVRYVVLIVAVAISLCSCQKENINSPDDEQVLAAYTCAREAYDWFNLTTMPLEDDAIEEKDGMEYVKVKHDTIHTYAQLKEYLQSLFAEDITDNLLSDENRYININGALYALPADRGSDITKGEERYEIIRENPRKIIYRITVDVLDASDLTQVIGSETYDMVYEALDGKWRFSTFYSIR